MPFITQGKTNWKFLVVVIVLAIIVGGGALWYTKKTIQPYQPVEIKKQEKIIKPEEPVKKEILNWQTYRNDEYKFEIKYLEDFFNGSEIAIVKDVGKECEATNFPKECPNITYNWDKKGEIKLAPNEADKITINDTPFCFYKASFGIMTTYIVDKIYLYVTVKDNKCIFIQLPFRESWEDCDMGICLENHGIPECQRQCDQSRQKIEMNKNIRDQIISTFKFDETEIYNHAGIIEHVYSKDGKDYVDVNFMKFMLFTDPKIIYGEDDEKGDCEPGPDGYCVVDNDKTIKSYQVAEDVEIFTSRYGTMIPYEYFKEYVAFRFGFLCRLQIKNNIIQKMDEIYTP